MTLEGLSGNLWPIHLKPLPDELLSSWLVRLAHAHGLKLQSLCSLVFGRDKAIWNRDIDKLAPEWLIEKLAECTGSSFEEVLGTTLKSYEGVLYEHHQPNGNTKWLLPLGVYHRTHNKRGLQYCPQCLAEDAEPYFRKRWRLAFSTMCTKHHCYLLDACPQCESSVEPHRSDMRGRSFYPSGTLSAYCWKCGFDLRTASVENLKNSSSARWQVQLEFALENGYIDWAENPAMHSVVFFEGVRELIAGMTSKSTRERLTKSARLSEVTLNGWTSRQFELVDQSQRRELLKLLAIVLDNWPRDFIELIHECRLRYADLKGDAERRMYWYEDVIRREAGGGYAALGKDEVGAIVNAVIAKDGKFTQMRARELSGRDISKHVQDREVQPVSDEVYEDLLTSIDHQIAGTLDKTERASLIRDKVMFAAGRVLGLSQQRLADLTLERVRELVPEEAEVSFVEVAKTPAQARAWVEWYWNRMRPQLKPRQEVDRVFTSAMTRRGFRHSAVGLKFEKAVDVGMIRRAVSNYTNWMERT